MPMPSATLTAGAGSISSGRCGRSFKRKRICNRWTLRDFQNWHSLCRKFHGDTNRSALIIKLKTVIGGNGW